MWSRRSIEIFAGVSLLAMLSACSVAPRRDAGHGDRWVVVHSAGAAKLATAGNAARPGAGGGSQAVAGPPPVPAEARQEFDAALALAGAGNDPAAESQLATLAHRYPQFCTPLVDLGILHRKDGDLDAAAQALQQAVAREPRSALAWTELGVTQRLGGKFQDAEQSYGRAIAADAAYAPAYRNRGVLRDLYLDQPAAALGDFEQYRKLAGGDKQVLMWIAELQHRTGIKVPPGGQPTAASATGVRAQPPAPVTRAPAHPPNARN
ncbi:MAG: tetratricopeptide repeat protein [Gammaproteobacteria bacterium]|nr:tetratricopeptide repeat protein [Gammaproteobacteria bacterium]